ncbi:PREDICTED: alpha-mannosidase I MNS5-like [Camelina sativa]|uniref:alpha-1,2-Mannosidase n=1 Tax=Camelina sativa TaxID=90675 RepID=A0ABM1R617_CAMSA|nr:PREDICTED: alpha-mannosidase I MNS5-like [Camelina sativa]
MYHEANMWSGKPTYWQLTSLQAFWPGLQVLAGDIAAANSTHREFFHVWEKFGVLPERYLLDHQMIHPTMKYYPLRPELAESTFYLYQATKDPWYLDVGEIEGHPIQVVSSWHEKVPKSYFSGNWTLSKRGAWESGASALSLQVCPSKALNSRRPEQHRESACHVHVPDEQHGYYYLVC